MDTFDKYADEIYQQMIDETHADVLNYGTILYDNEMTENSNYYRLRVIDWETIIYVDWMRNGVVVFCESLFPRRTYDKRIEMSNGI